MDKERKFRIVVSSAEEAVRLIRKHLGEKAKVISVKQVEGKGLARFLGSPQLEVIATIANEEDPILPSEIPVNKLPVPESMAPKAETALLPPVLPPINHTETPTFEAAAVYTARSGEPIQSLPDVNSNLSKVLEKFGFDKTFLTQFMARKNIKENLTLDQGLRQFFENLRSAYDKLPIAPVHNRVVFLGPPATGKTLALCKYLTHEVFVKNKPANVLRIENDLPKTDEALEVFCNVLGVPIFREGINDKDLTKDSPLYVDLPGFQLSDAKEHQQILRKLDKWEIKTRVLVLNALYESEFLDKCISMATTLGVTHLVFTHLDETISVCKLWKYLLNSGLSLLFLTNGQSLTSEYIENILPFLFDKTISAPIFQPR